MVVGAVVGPDMHVQATAAGRVYRAGEGFVLVGILVVGMLRRLPCAS